MTPMTPAAAGAAGAASGAGGGEEEERRRERRRRRPLTTAILPTSSISNARVLTGYLTDFTDGGDFISDREVCATLPQSRVEVKRAGAKSITTVQQ